MKLPLKVYVKNGELKLSVLPFLAHEEFYLCVTYPHPKEDDLIEGLENLIQTVQKNHIEIRYESMKTGERLSDKHFNKLIELITK